jgi:hypothetical protein
MTVRSAPKQAVMMPVPKRFLRRSDHGARRAVASLEVLSYSREPRSFATGRR